ncbi:DUF262 domain-containing protein [Gaopeijia maritima]|uniref:DUF262 domain-containing protein n=1 Tax=Gaopeijia maritima TaxID=3119007 RepID=UPI00329438E4
MSINRSDSRIFPLAYSLEYRIAPQDTDIWDSSAARLDPAHVAFGAATVGGGRHGPDNFFIPTFQRGIEWTWDKLHECVTSRSPLLGEVTMGMEAQQPGKIQLLDGLQRFAAFTALSSALQPILFASDEADLDQMVASGTLSPKHLLAAKELQVLGQSQSGSAPILTYNDAALEHHRRAVLKETYASFRGSVAQNVAKALTDPQNAFLDTCVAFYKKYMWVNLYQTFQSHEELVSAFVGWNAIRIELGLADLCRAALINRGSQAGWTHAQFVEAEDRFNSLLLETGGNHKKYYGPFFTLLHEDWFEEGTFNILPELSSPTATWQSVDRGFERLSETMDYFDGQVSGTDPQKQEYIRYLKLLGDLPFITTLIHYYRTATARSSLQIDQIVQVDVLHKLAVAYTRRLLDSSIGNTGSIADQILKGKLSVSQWIDAITPDKSGSFGAKPDAAWLQLRLENAGISSAKAIFSACLLPTRKVRGGSRQWGKGAFTSLFVRTGGKPRWSLDHVIPKSSFKGRSPGDAYQDSLRNLMPILTKDNSSYNKMDADTKIRDSHAAWYGKYRTGGTADRHPGGSAHPMHDALFKTQGRRSPSELNSIDQLANGVGPERLGLLHAILLDKL